MAFTPTSEPINELKPMPGDLDAAGQDHANWLMSRSRAGREVPHQSLLLLRFLLVNIVAFALLAAVYLQGWIDAVLAGDTTYLSVVIFGVFLVGLAFCAQRVWRTSRELNQIKALDPLESSTAADYLAKLRGRSGEARALFAANLRLKLSHRIAIVRHIAGSLVLLGLIGTVIGFIIALSGVDPEQAGDVQSIAPMVSTMIQGLSTALYTTLVGAVLNLWLMVNYRLLAGGVTKQLTALTELGEDHARA